MTTASHIVKVQLKDGKSYNKFYGNTGEADIAFHLQDYKREGAKYEIEVVTVWHQDGSICPEWAVA